MSRPTVLFSNRRTILVGMMSATALLFVSSVLTAQGTTDVGFIDPLSKTASLKTVPAPAPPAAKFAKIVTDRNAVVLLGKALFWDQQLGSDGQACASCHFHAGADNRSKNTLNPGFRSTLVPGGNTTFSPGFGPNYQLTPQDFPFHKINFAGSLLSDSNNVVGSQGAFNADLLGLNGTFDLGAISLSDIGAVFSVGTSKKPMLVRSVAPRNTPTIVNAVFNDRNFWDGRARNEFNGVDPIGLLDPYAQIIQNSTGVPNFQNLQLTGSSAASQSTGPPGSNIEMSFNNRVTDACQMAFIGRKMLSLQPLALQLVARDDSTLGSLSAQNTTPGATGLNTTYAHLIQAAFDSSYWDGTAVNGKNKWIFSLTGQLPPAVTRQPVKVAIGTVPTASQFELIEANFSLFFGLAIQEYERTLIANDSRFDKHMEVLQYKRDGTVPQGYSTTFNPGVTTLTDQEQQGLQLFLGKGQCINCHGGAGLSNAAVGSVEPHQPLERMIVENGIGVYDTGFYNTSVRPTGEDLGIGATIGPLNLPLSNTVYFQQQVQNQVQILLAANPALSMDAAIRQANTLANVPPILARPLEVQTLLQQSGISTIYQMQNIKDGLQTAVNALATSDPNQAQGNSLLADVQSLLDKANTLFFKVTPGQVADAGVLASNSAAAAKLVTAYTKLAQTALLVPAAAQLRAQTLLLQVPGSMLMPDLLKPNGQYAPPLQPTERAVVMGCFKTPTIRNVELTAPYFHNGGELTLGQVVDFYNRGGNFPDSNANDLDADITPLLLTQTEEDALVAFMKACTDDRVRYERAPFDHPSLSIPNGGTKGAFSSLFGPPCLDDRLIIPAVGAGGLTTPPNSFLNIVQ
jgi:cytochrome c peroxidase